MRIGIVGTGIAGLTAGWLMRSAGHDVMLFERSDRIGMAAHGIQIETSVGSRTIDVPPRLFNVSQWPTYVRLLECLGVELQQLDVSKSFRRLGDDRHYLRLSDSFQPKLGLALRNKTARRIARDAKKLLAQISNFAAATDDQDWRSFLDEGGYSDDFVFRFLYPALASTVCTCSYGSLNAYPAAVMVPSLLAIFGNNLASSRPLFRTRLGTQDVVERLMENIDKIHFNAEVVAVSSNQREARIDYCQEGETQREFFDHIVIATQANQAANFASELSFGDQQMLGLFDYEDIEVVVHSDQTFMETDSGNWSLFNFVCDENQSMCTVWSNVFDSEILSDQPIFQTINPIAEPAVNRVWARHSLQRPVVTRRSLEAWQLLANLHQESDRRIWYCGSYASPGIPLLESAVVSSYQVADCLGVNIPAATAPISV